MGELGWIDLVLLGILAGSIIVGLWRGLVFELMSLVGWLVAYVLAQMFSPDLAAHLPVGTPGSALNAGVAFAITFVVVLIVWSLLARLASLLIHATPLTLIDRLLGAVFGALRGLVLLLALATLVAFTPAVDAPAWQHSQGARWLNFVLQAISSFLPESIARHLP